MVARTAGRKGRTWRKVQAEVYAEETHCCLCRGYVDQTLVNYRQSRARSVHHLIPPDIAPELAQDRGNLRLAHIGCNARHGRGVYQGGYFMGGPIYGPPHGAHTEGMPTTGGLTHGLPSSGPTLRTPALVTSRVW
jgi:hypothetical protein